VRDHCGMIVDFEYVEANKAACEYNGVEHRDLVGARLLDLFPGHVDSGLLDKYRQVVETGEPLILDDFTYATDPSDGGSRFFEIRAVRVGDALSCAWRDVTDRHRALEAAAAVEARYRLLAENATDVVILIDPDWKLAWVSPATRQVLGYDPATLVGANTTDGIHPDDLAVLASVHGMPADDHVGVSYRVRVRDAAGNYRWMSAASRAAFDAHGNPAGRISTMRDIHEQVLAQQALERSEAHFRMLAENSSDVVAQLDADNMIRWLSPSAEPVLGWRPDELLGTPAINLVHPEDLPALSRWQASLQAGVAVAPLEVRSRMADGGFRWMSLHARPTLKPDGGVGGAVMGLRDVHEQVIAREHLARSEAMFRLAMAGAPQGMAVVGLHGRFLRVNDVLCALVGRDSAWMHEHDEYDVIHPDDLATDQAARDRLLAGDAELDIHEGRLVTASGEQVWVQHSLALVRDEHDMPVFYVSQYQNITGARAAKQDLQYRAEHDMLTGLINRGQLQEHLVDVLRRQSRTAGVPGVLFCDLDFFKTINDTHGHASGDYVLRVVAERIEAALRNEDQVARLGGDEFVAVLPEVTDTPAAIGVAERIRSVVAQPIPLGAGQITITTSVGIALATPDIGARQLLRNADSALYEAKNAGRDRIAVFGPDRDPADGSA
ncbi:MAG: PAS domain S-box protein, partial [Actinomycetes bacterium]